MARKDSRNGFTSGRPMGRPMVQHQRFGGAVCRTSPQFRNWVTSDGSAGPSGISGFKAEPDRYHLYVSLACPWAHRTLIFRELKGLQSIISISVVHWHMAENGWTFKSGEGVVKDTVNGVENLYQLYSCQS